MKHRCFFILFVLSACQQLFSQSCRDVSVELSATVQENPPQITLQWVANSSSTQYQLYRKLKTDATWGNAIITLSGSAVQYTDAAVSTGISYEYKIMRTGANFTGYGYINAGINIPVAENRGIIILIVDSTFTGSCASRILRLQGDLEGDGWKVLRHDVSRSAPVPAVKALITADYYNDPFNTKAVFLLGHVPVPYSGNINPDGHPDHLGAWPADVFYADIDGVWTDVYVNSSTASDPRNRNIPGDGKYDQSMLPSDVELQIGRVDFANMPAFSYTETQLLNNYLDKDHDYRVKNFSAVHRGVIDDNFGYFSGEAFAASGWKNFGPLVGPSNVTANDYFSTMTGNSYLWSYGCGGGSYTSAGGIGSTSDFAASNLQGVFTILFGSYFGDWDSQNNFLRAPLAQGKMLTDVWSGRPHWVFHHMALGENIGYDVRISQNNSSLYFYNYAARYIHMALMGDPSLRNDVVAPVSNVVASVNGNNCTVSWTASPDNPLGYYIYMKNNYTAGYIRINPTPTADTTYIDSCLYYPGLYTYMVRALILQTSPGGTYYNLSEGIADTAWHPDNYTVTASATYTIVNNTVSFTSTSLNATIFHWDFGDGSTSNIPNPIHTFASGSYNVSLTAGNGCTTDVFNISLQGFQMNSLQGILSYNNSVSTGMPNTSVRLLNSSGTVIASTNTDATGYYSFSNIPDGNYSLTAETNILPGGINSTDALLVLRHFVHLSLLTGLNFIAGDVDNNNIINSVDALMISKRFTGELSSFPNGQWYFEQPLVTLNGNTSFTVNFRCICYGDCNGSFIP